MAQSTGTQSSYDLVGAREELADTISMITPQETPLYSDLSRVKVKSVHPEWQTDTLATPAANAQIEADNYTYSAPAATTRVGTYTQISWKTGLVSETADAVDKAGRDKETTREKMKRGIELRKDIEFIILSNQASVAGSDTVARQTAGFPAWITSNDSRGSGGSDGGFSSGIVAAATTGTQRALTKAITDNVLMSVFNSGGNVKNVYVSPYVKGVQSTFMSDSNVIPLRYAAKGSENNKIIGAADVYLSDYGEVTFKANRVMATSAAVARRALFVDSDKTAVGFLRPIQEDKDVAKTGDAEPFVIKAEWALIMRNQAAHGSAEDLFGLTAST